MFDGTPEGAESLNVADHASDGARHDRSDRAANALRVLRRAIDRPTRMTAIALTINGRDRAARSSRVPTLRITSARRPT